MTIDNIVEKYRPKQVEQAIPLEIIGDSAFTRALLRRCTEWNVPYLIRKHPSCEIGPVVVDREVSTDTVLRLRDIDTGIYKLSACAESVATLCGDTMSGQVVTIVGRGPSVYGLADYMIKEGATVCVCTRFTPQEERDELIRIADILVDTRDGVIVKTENRVFSNSEVGRLTCAILANRAVLWRERISNVWTTYEVAKYLSWRVDGVLTDG